MSCKYCDGSYNRIVQEPDDSENSEGLGAWIVEDKLCLTGFYNGGPYGADYIYAPSSAKINYCPMCGQKLEYEEIFDEVKE